MKSTKWLRRRAKSYGKCKLCILGDYPYYGMAPHEHIPMIFEGKEGIATRILPREQWPSNFTPDEDQERDFQENGLPVAQGTWYCPNNCIGQRR